MNSFVTPPNSRLVDVVLEALPIGVAVIDAAQRVVVCNPAYCASLDLPPNSLPPGMPMVDAIRASAYRGVYGPGDPDAQVAAILAPGPDGAVSTERFENFREGTELCEAILYLEKALAGKKISGELEQKVNRYLDERGEVFIKYWYTRRASVWDAGQKLSIIGQVERDARLLALCAEVAAAAK